MNMSELWLPRWRIWLIKHHWHFHINWHELILWTPLFGFYFAEYAKDWRAARVWRGFTLLYKPTKNPKEGDLMYHKEVTFVFEEISQREQILSLGEYQ
jgi:hypothetical protein